MADFSETLGGILSANSPDEAFWPVYRTCKAVYDERESTLLNFTSPPTVKNAFAERVATMVGAPSVQERGYVTSLLRKSVLYSDLTVISVPLPIEGTSVSYSNYGRIGLGGASKKNLGTIVDLNTEYRDLVMSGKAVVLPDKLDYTEATTRYDLLFEYSPPLIRESDASQPLPLLGDPLTTGAEQVFLFKQILLPYFPELDLVTISKLAQEETESFIRFNRFLKERSRQLLAADSQMAVSDIIEEIEYEVAGLRLEADRIAKKSRLRDATVGAAVVSFAVLLASKNPLLTGVSGFLGTASLLDIVKERIARKDESEKLRQSNFYIPYLFTSARYDSESNDG